MSQPLVIHVNRLEDAADLGRDDVVGAVRATAEAERVATGEISVTFIDAAAMSALNATHLGCQGPTDVIAFNLGERDAPFGDIYICPEVARTSAEELGLELREELLRLVVHGALHLFGHDHPSGPERLESDMFRRQEAILAQLL